MNRHQDQGHRHVNGQQHNEVDEAELDAYQEKLTAEAIVDQVKVTSHSN